MNKWYKYAVLFFASGSFVGYIPFVSGTLGSLLGLILYVVLHNYLTTLWLIIISIIFFFMGVYASHKAEQILNEQDSSKIVIDEIVGMIVTMLFLRPNLTNLAAGFITFRAFDIIKPPPISYVDKNIHGGFGVMFDDLIAGVFANIVIHAVILLYHL